MSSTPDLPPRPGEEELAQAHGRRILQAAIAVAQANQARHEVAETPGWTLDDLVAAAARLELAVGELTEACVEAQIASNARWS